MSRPTRMAATARVKSYAEMDEGSNDSELLMGGGGEGEDSVEEEDDSFDEDDDPDKIEVPGGGTNLENSRKIATTTAPASTSSKSAMGYEEIPSAHKGNFNTNPSPSSTATTMRRPHPQLIPTTTSSSAMGRSPSFALHHDFKLPSDTTISLSGLSNAYPSSMPMATSDLLSNTPPIDFLASLLMAGNLLPKEGLYQALQNAALLGAPYNNFGGVPGHYSSSQGAQSHLSADAMIRPLGLNAWAKQNMNMNMNMMPLPEPKPKVEAEEETQEDYEESLNIADTYAEYVPAKLKYGMPHPDPIVETSSLSSVPPPEVYYKIHLPSKCVSKGYLSSMQLEALVYACQQHEFFFENKQRAGYLIGDGAGVGKGRTIAGIIYENILCGRTKALWVSVSADLKEDAIRDLRDIGADEVVVHALSKLKYGKLKEEEGVLFSTYAGLIGESSVGGKFNTRYKQIVDWLGPDYDGVVVFDECHRAKNLCPVGSTKPTKTGVTVQKLQDELPNARVVYASATGASEPRNMAYMTRLGIWGPGTPFHKFMDFINAVEKRGIGAMEIVAMDMKLRGAYIARQLSFKGVTFRVEDAALTTDYKKMYNDCVELWVEIMQRFIETGELMQIDPSTKKCIWGQFWSSHQRFFKYLCIGAKVDRAVQIARQALKDDKCVVIGLQSTGEARTAEQMERVEYNELDDFVSTAKGVIQNLVEKHLPAPDRTKIERLLGISLNDPVVEEPTVVAGTSSKKGKPMRKAAQNASKRAKWNNDSDASSGNEEDSDFSGGSGSEGDDDEEDDVSTDSKASESEFDSVSEPESDSEAKGKGRKRKIGSKGTSSSNAANTPRTTPTKEAFDQAYKIRQELLEKIDKLGAKMPSNTLDRLIDELGGASDVAEMTGRKMRLIQGDNGKIAYESRAEFEVSLDQINLTEKRRFMDGEKNVAIISEAASSGISLQSDRRAKNKRRRVHITLELPWSADRAIQQFGRTHRSNQTSAPEYVFLISDLAGEQRFASIVAKRLESLGALTHGDRRATETRDLSRFHIDNKYGKQALGHVISYIMTGNIVGLPALAPTALDGPFEVDFRHDVAGALVGVGLIVNPSDAPGCMIADKDFHNISKFLNRILGMKVVLQNSLFKFFTDSLAGIIKNAKRQGRFDMGILNLGDWNADKTSIVSSTKYSRQHATGAGSVELLEIAVERGMSWEEAHLKFTEMRGVVDGFYLANEEKNDKRVAILVCGDDFSSSNEQSERKERKRWQSDKTRLYSIYRPSTGLQLRREVLEDVQTKYVKASSIEEAKKHWEGQYHDAADNCIHAFWSGKCKNRAAGFPCDIGKRRRTYYVLSGSVLLCWDDVENAMLGGNNKIQIVRLQFNTGQKFAGILIPHDCVSRLKARLAEVQRLEELSKVKMEESEGNEEKDFE